MVKARRKLGLAQEAAAKALVPRQLGREELERDEPPGARLLGQVDGARRPLPEQRLHAKAGEESTHANLKWHRLQRASQATGPSSRISSSSRRHHRVRGADC